MTVINTTSSTQISGGLVSQLPNVRTVPVQTTIKTPTAPRATPPAGKVNGASPNRNQPLPSSSSPQIHQNGANQQLIDEALNNQNLGTTQKSALSQAIGQILKSGGAWRTKFNAMNPLEQQAEVLKIIKIAQRTLLPASHPDHVTSNRVQDVLNQTIQPNKGSARRGSATATAQPVPTVPQLPNVSTGSAPQLPTAAKPPAKTRNSARRNNHQTAEALPTAKAPPASRQTESANGSATNNVLALPTAAKPPSTKKQQTNVAGSENRQTAPALPTAKAPPASRQTESANGSTTISKVSTLPIAAKPPAQEPRTTAVAGAGQNHHQTVQKPPAAAKPPAVVSNATLPVASPPTSASAPIAPATTTVTPSRSGQGFGALGAPVISGVPANSPLAAGSAAYQAPEQGNSGTIGGAPNEPPVNPFSAENLAFMRQISSIPANSDFTKPTVFGDTLASRLAFLTTADQRKSLREAIGLLVAVADQNPNLAANFSAEPTLEQRNAFIKWKEA